MPNGETKVVVTFDNQRYLPDIRSVSGCLTSTCLLGAQITPAYLLDSQKRSTSPSARTYLQAFLSSPVTIRLNAA